MTTPLTIERVRITPTSDGGFDVWPIWSGGADRPEGTGYHVKDTALARRLERAILAGVVYYEAEVRTDINGRTYVNDRSRLLGRTINADLNRLGY